MEKIKISFAIVGFGFCAFLVAFVLGSVLTMTTGIPLLGGLINGVFVAMILTVGLLSIQRFGTATSMWFVFSLFCIFTTTLGPPGIYKVVIGLVAGFIWDIVYFGTRRSTVGLYLGAILGAISIMVLLIFALKLGLVANPGETLRKYVNAIYAIVTINVIVTFLGVLLGHQLFRNRLSKIQMFRDLALK